MQRKVIKTLLSWLLSLLLGCGKSIYYYQSDGLTLKLQGRAADASEPVQGTFGFKDRVVLVTPPKENGNDTVSLLSGFSFDKKPGLFGPVYIRSALITGTAAHSLQPGEAIAAGLALQGEDIPTTSQTTKKIIDNLNAAQRKALFYHIKNRLLDPGDATKCTEKPKEADAEDFLKLAGIAVYTESLCSELLHVLP